MFGGANGRGGQEADADALIDLPVNYRYGGSKTLEIQAIFVTDGNGAISVSFNNVQPVKPRPDSIDAAPGTIRAFLPQTGFSGPDPNAPLAIKINMQNLQSLSDAELNAAETAPSHFGSRPANGA